MSRVLVTGGAGFIGSHLCERLLADGHDVTCLDDLSTGSAANVAGLDVVIADVCNPLSFDVDQIYHLACPASPVAYQRDPVQTIRTCVIGTMRVLELAERTGARVLLASTSEVYGDPVVHPQPESYCGNVSTTGPRACYDEGKRCAEALAASYAQQHGVSVRIARIFNTYGPRMAGGDGRVVPQFIGQCRRGEPMTVFGDGSQTRSFCYVTDTVDGLVRLMASDCAEPVNIGNPSEITMLGLARAVREVTCSRSGIVHAPLPVDDPRRRRPDIARAIGRLGWAPSVSLADGLARTIADVGTHVYTMGNEA